MKGMTRVVVLVLVAVLPFRAVSARPSEDRREVQGRVLFAKGDYQAALEVYANLFAEKGDPVYLRNIGRCYQNLEQPEKAIKSFREYLRRGHVKEGERAEVEGFIKDMQEMEKKGAAAPAPTQPAAAPSGGPPADTAPASLPTEVTQAPPPVTSDSNSAPGATLTASGTAEEAPEQTSITSRWWFWTGLAVVVAGGAAAAFVMTRPQGGMKPSCPIGSSTGECL
jgi:hypothetical protein